MIAAGNAVDVAVKGRKRAEDHYDRADRRRLLSELKNLTESEISSRTTTFSAAAAAKGQAVQAEVDARKTLLELAREMTQ